MAKNTRHFKTSSLLSKKPLSNSEANAAESQNSLKCISSTLQAIYSNGGVLRQINDIYHVIIQRQIYMKFNLSK